MKKFSVDLDKLKSLIQFPQDVQKLLYDIDYSRTESMKSALSVWKSGSGHCLEAVHFAALVMENLGFPPLALSLDSADNICHVVYPFKTSKGWGSLGRSKEPGLHGRAPQFRSIRDLAYSYYDPYVDDTGRLTGYALVNLDQSGGDWRYSKKNVWASERNILRTKHTRVIASKKRFEKALLNYKSGGHESQSFWW